MKRFLGYIAACLLSAGCIIGGNIVNAHAAPPPVTAFRWADFESPALCQYDRGANTANNLGGCNSATRWTRSNCGNRTAGGKTLFYCEYHSQASGDCMSEGDIAHGSLIGVTTDCSAQTFELFSDPDSGGVVRILWDMENSRTSDLMESNNGSGSVISSGNSLPDNSWELCPSSGTCS